LRLTTTTGNREQSFTMTLQPFSFGVVRDAQNGTPLAGATVAALPVTSLIALEPQTTSADGTFGFSNADGIYRLEVTLDGYQPYQTDEIAVTNGLLAQDVALTLAINEPPTHTVQMTADGFEPAFLEVKPGDVIEWLNADLADHATVRGDEWDSGILATGERFRIKLDAEGTFSYADSTNSLNTGTIVVTTDEPEEPTVQNRLFLPLVSQ
jgi:plastocyanin